MKRSTISDVGTDNPCTNCSRRIVVQEPHPWVHFHTLKVLCDVSDLRDAGYSESEVNEQVDGIATYSACPVPPPDDEP